jgi:hypothetical protein
MCGWVGVGARRGHMCSAARRRLHEYRNGPISALRSPASSCETFFDHARENADEDAVARYMNETFQPGRRSRSSFLRVRDLRSAPLPIQ